jgi:hypothetical protein
MTSKITHGVGVLHCSLKPHNRWPGDDRARVGRDRPLSGIRRGGLTPYTADIQIAANAGLFAHSARYRHRSGNMFGSLPS